MSKEVAGVPLKVFKDPILAALERYAALTDGRISFNPKELRAATNLGLTSDKPNSARSTLAVHHLGEVAGTLVVIAFAPHDGTGDEKTHRLSELNVSRRPLWPYGPKTVPRSKAGIHSEAHLTIATIGSERPQATPDMYSGNLDVLGLVDGNRIEHVADVGHEALRFMAMAQGIVGELHRKSPTRPDTVNQPRNRESWSVTATPTPSTTIGVTRSKSADSWRSPMRRPRAMRKSSLRSARRNRSCTAIESFPESNV